MVSQIKSVFLIAKNQAPLYLCNVTSPSLPLWRRNQLDNPNRFNQIYARTKFNDSFFLSCTVDWNDFDGKLKEAINKKSFQSSLLKLVRTPKSNNFKILDNIGLKYLTQLRVRLNDLKRYKFDHNFEDAIDPMCSANDGAEDVTHFLLFCHLYTHIRIELLRQT